MRWILGLVGAAGGFGLVALVAVDAGAGSGNVIATPDPADDVGYTPSLALDAAGNPVVSYTDGVNADLKIIHCGNPDCTANNSITSPDTDSSVGLFTSLALDASGNPVVAYYDITNDSLKVLHCVNANCTGANTIETPATSLSGGFEFPISYPGPLTSLALNASGNPVIAYRSGSNLTLLICGDPNCGTVSSSEIFSPGGSSLTLKISPMDNPVVSYYDESSGDLKVLFCFTSDCGSSTSIDTPDSAGDVGNFAAMALASAGNPVIAYRDASNGRLKVLLCNSPAGCNLPQMFTPIFLDPVDISLALDANDYPVFSFVNTATGSMHVVHCASELCNMGGNSITSPDPDSPAGFMASLQLDAFGNPVIAYLSGQTGDVVFKVLHCGDPTCPDAASPTPTLTSVPTMSPTAEATPTPAPSGSPTGTPGPGTPTPEPTGSGEPTPTIPCPAGQATPPGDGCLPCPTAGPLGIQSTCPPLGHVLLWGDDNCSGEADPVDSLLTLRHDAGLSTNTGACPDMGHEVSVSGAGVLPWGDVDCSGDADPVDSLKLLRYDAGLAVNQPDTCPDIGENALLNPVS